MIPNGLLRLALIVCLSATPALAAPERYQLDPTQSRVGFSYVLDGARQTGRMPVKSADIQIDLDNLPASRVEVVLNAHAAQAGFIIATQTMRGPRMLDTARHPEIRFRSTGIRGDLNAATMTGDLTVRGITRPVTLRAGLYRRADADPADRNRLAVRLTGSISRSAFGADGYAAFVGDRIGLEIVVRIVK